MIDLDKLRESEGYMLAIVNTKTGEYEPVSKEVQQVRHGYWIDIDEQSYTWKVRCSCCDHERSMMSTQGEYPNYCENCGCRMVEDER